jgi:hypothetical protein
VSIRRNLALALTALCSVAVHGYHLGTDDGAIYAPAIKKAADPSLYPLNEPFFTSHARLSLFPNLVGGSARLSGIPADWVIFIWHILGIFLLLEAAWLLARALFESEAARWGAVALLAGLLTVPVAGTALVIMDPYLTARSLSTPAALMAVACWVSGGRKQAIAWLILTALAHPQMAAYAAVFLAILAMSRGGAIAGKTTLAGALALPVQFDFRPAAGAAREALLSRTYFFVFRWEWYEWIGVAAPLALLWVFGWRRVRGTNAPFAALAGALLILGALFTAAGVIVSSSPHLENFTRLQPMRAFHLLYAIFFVMVGGLIGEHVLRRATWRWAALVFPLAAGMWMLGQATYPDSAHIEFPGVRPGNAWSETFLWIRGNTPKQAVFALDPDYMKKPGEDLHGFRAVAERSALADRVKDSGAVSLFPGLAEQWQREVRATEGWEHFGAADFERLAKDYGVSWIVRGRPVAGLDCPFSNSAATVCRLK